MFIEDLIRLGRPLLEGDTDPQEVLRLITDVEDARVKNFYRHVFVVELPADGQREPRALPVQQFGDLNSDGDFEVDRQRAVGVPFVLPSGGNPLSAQGAYGLPVYPLYHKHLFGNPKDQRRPLREGFLKSQEAISYFLRQRSERTQGFDLSEDMLSRVAAVLQPALLGTDFAGEKNVLGVLVLARCEAGGFYSIAEGVRGDRIGQTADGRPIVPNYARVLEAFWAAKVEEGREAGKRSGECSFSGAGGEVVSAYCKAWPWAFPTWTCPLPHGGKKAMLVEGVALAPETYRALVLGACVFNKLARPVSHLVIPQIFAPADTRAAPRRKLNDLPKIYGSAFLLPVQDGTLDEPDQRYEFTRGIRAMLRADPDDPTLADRYLTTVTGFDVLLPEDLDANDYRLTLVYFSGQYTRGDVHLRACIQDVIPSTLNLLRDLARSEARMALRLLRDLGMSEKQLAYFGPRYESVPYLLVRAYGGAYLWQQLEALLHRRPLEPRRVTANVARRLESLAHRWPDSRFDVADEVGFHLSFLNFLGRANRELAGRLGDDAMPMRPWKQLLEMVDKGPVADLALDDVAELGFACGALVKRFSRSYYAARKAAKPDADYLRERVLTFGTDLRPAAIHDKGLRMILELPNRIQGLARNRDLEERVGAAVVAFQRLRGGIERQKDDFVTAFWAGYSLQGYDRPRKTKSGVKEPTTTNPE
jgi:hypothetical protein